MRLDFTFCLMPLSIDFTLRLPRIRGRYPSFSVVPAPRFPMAPRFYAQRIKGGYEVRLWNYLVFAGSHAQRR